MAKLRLLHKHTEYLFCNHYYFILPIAFLFLFLFPEAGLTQENLSPVEKQIAIQIQNENHKAMSFLEKVTNINSGTMNHQGVKTVGKIFQGELESIGFKCQWIPMPKHLNRAGHLFAYRKGKQGKRLLLIGHLDTVFEPESPFQKYEKHGKKVTGPGVIDMKGGSTLLLYALKALHASGTLDNATITVALIGDEENAGEPLNISRRDLIAAAKQSDIALGFEGSPGLSSAIVARRGFSSWSLKVTGKQRHSSRIFSKSVGGGAIFEAARILNSFYERVRGEKYLTFNAGIILGGTRVNYEASRSSGTAYGKSNVIPKTLTVNGGLRFISESQKLKAQAKMKSIVSQHLPKTSANITFTDEYPALPPSKGNYKLLKLLDKVSQDLGYGSVNAYDPGARGAADISFVAPYVDGLDGLGAFGTGAHSPGEMMDTMTFPILTKRAALLMYRLTR